MKIINDDSGSPVAVERNDGTVVTLRGSHKSLKCSAEGCEVMIGTLAKRGPRCELFCATHGGRLNNCKTCGGGRSHWLYQSDTKAFICPGCNGDPEVEGTALSDWDARARARMIHMFGPRMAGDAALLAKYPDEDGPARFRERLMARGEWPRGDDRQAKARKTDKPFLLMALTAVVIVVVATKTAYDYCGALREGLFNKPLSSEMTE